ncbi:hypothetical protein GGX14DRAFT_402120 [Mycena pura]|uniref:Uncharacterized protein n=1 Tax=Mycena pura TaxID=153505 RepID=A0AAD6V173_9AGAR|nr:hypothetical protein GGX14DRAFT_402120 [Mycena pura]
MARTQSGVSPALLLLGNPRQTPRQYSRHQAAPSHALTVHASRHLSSRDRSPRRPQLAHHAARLPPIAPHRYLIAPPPPIAPRRPPIAPPTSPLPAAAQRHPARLSHPGPGGAMLIAAGGWAAQWMGVRRRDGRGAAAGGGKRGGGKREAGGGEAGGQAAGGGTGGRIGSGRRATDGNLIAR